MIAKIRTFPDMAKSYFHTYCLRGWCFYIILAIDRLAVRIAQVFL